MKTRFNPFTKSPEAQPEERTKSPKAARKTPKRQKRKRLPILSEQEALARAQQGNSWSNYPVIYAGFKAKGIPEDQIKPRENVFTFKAWNAQGRKVKKGEHGVKIHSVIETPLQEEVDPDKAAGFWCCRDKLRWAAESKNTEDSSFPSGSARLRSHVLCKTKFLSFFLSHWSSVLCSRAGSSAELSSNPVNPSLTSFCQHSRMESPALSPSSGERS